MPPDTGQTALSAATFPVFATSVAEVLSGARCAAPQYPFRDRLAASAINEIAS